MNPSGGLFSFLKQFLWANSPSWKPIRRIGLQVDNRFGESDYSLATDSEDRATDNEGIFIVPPAALALHGHKKAGEAAHLSG